MICDFATLEYKNQAEQVSWKGYRFLDNDDFSSFMSNDVAGRLFDVEGTEEFETHLRGLATTQFSNKNLNDVLAAGITEEREWAIGESIAEAWLIKEHNVIWPWNMERDKRTGKAVLPGADLVGFCEEENEVHLVLGEVKTSSENRCPPGVMNGRSGMRHQIDKLDTNLDIIYQLLRWLYFRCKNTEYEDLYDKAIDFYFNSGHKSVSLFGVLIRDTDVNELDLKARGETLSESVMAPKTCCLIALYLSCNIADLPERLNGGEAS